jgi:CMP-N-acetylneuraminic acid synthetase
MKVLVMIPARLGSKRIPKKNIRYLLDRPLLAYPIELVQKVGGVQEVFVNSESDLIGDLAVSRGAKFYKRPEHLSSDKSTNQDFVKDFFENNECDYIVMVNSTSPLLREKTLADFLCLVKTNAYDTVLSVLDEQAESFFKDEPLNFSFEKKLNSQDLEPVRKVVWALTAWKRSSFLEACKQGRCGIFSGKVGVFSIPKDECCDLDTPQDWAIAEGFLESRKVTLEKRYWSQD